MPAVYTPASFPPGRLPGEWPPGAVPPDAAKKATFTLNATSLARLERSAARLGLSKSRVVREAVQEYGERIGKLSQRERLRLLRAFDQLVPRIPERPAAEVDRELAAVRAARRQGGRRRGKGR